MVKRILVIGGSAKECKQKINKARKRCKELDGLVKKLYEGNATGKIPDKLKTDQFIQFVKRYTDFSELTTPTLNEFIEKVIVHEGEGRRNNAASRRNRRQRKPGQSSLQRRGMRSARQRSGDLPQGKRRGDISKNLLTNVYPCANMK